MYDELIKRLREVADEVDNDYDVDPYNAEQRCLAILQAADAIEELEDAIEDLEFACNRYEKDYKALCEYLPKWIPVSERLPEERINPNTHDFEYVLCATIWGDVRPFKYGTPIGSKDAHFWNGAGYVDAYITHWMPQPEPPKGEEK